MCEKPLSPRDRAVFSKKVWRDYCEQQAQQTTEVDCHIGIAASFTPNTLVPFLGAQILQARMKPEIHVGPYNQIFQICLDPKSYFGMACDTILVLWRLEDLMLEEILAFLNGDTSAFERASDKINLIASALVGLRTVFSGTVIAALPPYPCGVPAHVSNLDNSRGLGHFHRALIMTFVEKAGNIEGVRLFDLDALQRQFGLTTCYDARQWYLYRQPFSDLFQLEIGTGLARMIVARRRAAKKCVVLDCDNTLWGGIVGEDGVDGIQVGDDFPASAFRDFQRLLLYWRQQGILLAIASKNNEADVWEVFDQHSGMMLKREHISAWQINWNPKSENIPLIAKALNIGADSLVFIDDNPMEIAYMRAARPEVAVVQFPEDPADILAVLHELDYFDRLEITQEDRQRADMMRAEQQRENVLSSGLSKQDFLKELALQIDMFRASPPDLDRIAQLINKTNQFNLTTRRRSLDEVRALSASLNYRLFGLRVNDKFGYYGLTGVVVIEVLEKGVVWAIDTLLLSCRVLGRGVETVLLSAIATEARKEGAVELTAAFIPSAKNAPAASFLPDHGFKQLDEHNWYIALSDLATQ